MYAHPKRLYTHGKPKLVKDPVVQVRVCSVDYGNAKITACTKKKKINVGSLYNVEVGQHAEGHHSHLRCYVRLSVKA